MTPPSPPRVQRLAVLLLAGGCTYTEFTLTPTPPSVIEVCPGRVTIPPEDLQDSGTVYLALVGQASVEAVYWRPGITSTISFPNLDGTETTFRGPGVDGCGELALDYHFGPPLDDIDDEPYDDLGGMLQLQFRSTGPDPAWGAVYVRIDIDEDAAPMPEASCDNLNAIVELCPSQLPNLFEDSP